MSRIDFRAARTAQPDAAAAADDFMDVEVDAAGSTQVRYATAAHPPLLVSREGDAISVYQKGPFIGIVPSEQWNVDGHEFGLERVKHALGDRDRDLRGSIDQLVAEWDAFLGGHRPDDDATLIAIESLR